MNTGFLDLYLNLEGRQRDSFFCRARCQQLGWEQHITISYPLNENEVSHHAHWLGRLARSPYVDPEASRRFREWGGQLYESMFHGDLLPYFQDLRATADRQNAIVSVWICTSDPLLAATPWELLYDPVLESFLSLQKQFCLLRSMPTARPQTDETVSLDRVRTKVLVAGASPIDLANPHEKDEIEAIRSALAGAPEIRSNALHAESDLTWSRFCELIHERPAHLWHLIVHGTQDGFLIFEDDDKRTKPISYNDFGSEVSKALLPKLLILSVCFSDYYASTDTVASLAAALSSKVQIVLAMRSALTSVAAVEFSKSFYQALAQGADASVALGAARRHLHLLRGPESQQWSIPVMYQNTRVIPFPIFLDAKRLTEKPSIPFEKFRRFKRELTEFDQELRHIQEAISDSTPFDQALLNSTRYRLKLPEDVLQELQSLSGTCDPDWSDWLNETRFYTHRILDKFRAYQNRIEEMIDSEVWARFGKAQSAAHRIGEQISEDMNKLVRQLSHILEQSN